MLDLPLSQGHLYQTCQPRCGEEFMQFLNLSVSGGVV